MTEQNNHPDNKEWEVSAAQLRRTHGFTEPKNQKKYNAQIHKMEKLAKEILRLSRNTLLINLRFMESALVRFVPGKETVTTGIATDGQFLYYNSAHICRRFKTAREIPVRDYLHVVLHCLFRHLFIGKNVEKDVWDLACDIAVEHLITGLGLKALQCDREDRQRWLIEKLNKELPHLSAEHIYHYLLTQEDIPPADYEKIREDFYADDHTIWHKKAEAAGNSGSGDERDSAEPDGGDIPDIDSMTAEEQETTPPEEEEGSAGEGGAGETEENREPEGDGEGSAGSEGEQEEDRPAMTPDEIEQQWKDISERIQVDLDTLSNTWGQGAGDMQQALAEINREKYDYAKLLKRFTVLGENMEINDDEFDYIFYTYGMKLYENMPLVEPLEYKEVKKVREFVIALDTSESVSGELVQKFVTKTWNILKQSGNFFTKVNIHIIQCGAKVEEDVKITCDDEFDAYMKRMVLRGFGGTDFRPTFERVNSLIKQHEFQNLRGMIYFTDGYGTFPSMPPPYQTAFVFLDTERELPDIPPWVIRILLSGEQIRMF